MNDAMNGLIAAYFETSRILKSVFKLDSGVNYAACANLFCCKQKTADAQGLEACRKLLKSKENLFSAFRASAEMFTCASLLISGEAEAKLSRVQQNYRLLKNSYLDSSHLATTAFLLDDTCDPAQIPSVIERSRTLFKKMQKLHPLLTGTEDAPYCVMLAQSAKSDEMLIAEAEQIYTGLRKFASDNAAQTISHIFALSDIPADENISRLTALYQALEQAGRKYAKDLRLTILAALALPSLEPMQTAEEVLKIDAILSCEAEYKGILGEDQQNRLMHAAMIVSTMQKPHYAIAEYISVNAAIYIAIMIAVNSAVSASIITSTT